MPDRADAHIHLFEGGFKGSFTGRPGVTVDERALYASLAKEHGVKAALVVGYEGLDWAKGNNAYIGRLAAEHAWVRPVAFFDPAKPPTLDTLEELRRDRFVGLSFYVFEDAGVKAVQAIDDHVWAWLDARRWMISLNSKGPAIRGWEPVLERHKNLRLTLSHLGLPKAVKSGETLDAEQARAALVDVLPLARFPGAAVKLSGFYASTDPGHDYPHRAAWPYVQTLRDAFGVDRLLWGSDFTPAIDQLTFPQTLGLFGQMPFLSDADRARIEGGNLLARLGEVEK
jgi:L-fuconolactonase